MIVKKLDKLPRLPTLKIDPWNDKVFVVGVSGMGKSAWIKSYLKRVSRVVMFDAVGELSDGMLVTTNASHFAELVEARENRVSLQSESLDDFDWFCRVVYADEVINYLVVIDEVNLYCSANKLSEPFRRVITYGRKYGLGLLTACQRPVEIDHHLAGQANIYVCFGMHDPNDIKPIRTYIPGADEIIDLPPFSWLYYDTRTKERFIYNGQGHLVKS